MANGIRTLSGSVNGTMTYFTNNFPTLTTLSGTATWNTTYILTGISNLSFTIPAYNVSNGTQEIRILLSTAANFTSLSINTSNFTKICGFSDLELEPDKAYEISIMPLNANIVTLICRDVGEYFSPLPSGYTRLEYTQSTGTQYIDTGIKSCDEIKMTVIPTYITTNYQNNYLCGAWNGTNRGLVLLGARNPVMVGLGTTGEQAISTMSTAVNTKYKYDIKANSTTSCTLTRDNTVWNGSNSGDSITNTVNYYLFTVNYNGNATNTTSSASSIKLYYAEMYRSGALIRAFVPAIRNSDSAVGLYDLVNSAFYANSGSGKFSGEGLKTKSLIPTMTSNTAPYGVASCDSYRSGSIGAYGALNGGAWNLDSNCWVAADVAYPHWLQYQFVSPCEISYVQIGRTDVYCPKNFILQGSNDGTTWTNLTESLTMSSYTSLNTIFVTKNKGKYSYVRLYCTSSFQGSSATNTLAINYFQAYED